MNGRLIAISLLGGFLGFTALTSAPAESPVYGFASFQPTVYLKLATGMTIHLKRITYDSFGYVASYEEDITTGSKTLLLKIAIAPGLKTSEPGSYQYAIEVDGRKVKSLTLADWQKAEAKGLVGFAPKDLGGAAMKTVEGRIPQTRSSLAYDDFGRQMLSSQEFTLESILYKITYSDCKFDSFGRLSEYSAQVSAGN